MLLSSRAERGISPSERGAPKLISVINKLMRDPSPAAAGTG
jgi:hypothetical protein